MIFHSTRKKIDFNLKIKINGNRLYSSPSVKYLGIIIDENLSWKNHLNELTKKLSRANSMLCKVRHFVDKPTLRSIYFSIFSSHLTYGSLIWGQKGSPNRVQIESLQKSAIRIMSFSPFRSHTASLFPELAILKFKDHITLMDCMLVYDHIHNNLPPAISNLFKKTSEVHFYPTRNNEHGKLSIPIIKTSKYGKYSIVYQCVMNWNSQIISTQNYLNNISSNITSINDLTRSQYKKILHNLFLSSYTNY